MQVFPDEERTIVATNAVILGLQILRCPNSDYRMVSPFAFARLECFQAKCSDRDESFNSITGLNGSGKSNILDAICFVLGITNMTTVRAQNLQVCNCAHSSSFPRR